MPAPGQGEAALLPCLATAVGEGEQEGMSLVQAECLGPIGHPAGTGALPSVGSRHSPAASCPRQGEMGRVVETLADSFPAIVDRYQAPLISFLYGMVGDREHAEDLAQDTFVKVYDALGRRRAGQQYTSGWLFRVARNTAIDALRRRRLISWLPFGDEYEPGSNGRPPTSGYSARTDSSGDFAGRLAERELVQQVLARLPARYRECLLLRSVAGLSSGEIAEAMHISVRNVNTTLFRARERFRRVYAELESPPGTVPSLGSGRGGEP